MTHVLALRPLVAAVVPAAIVVAVFHLGLGLDLRAALGAGIVWALGSLLVTHLLYDDAPRELAAFHAAAPHLTGAAAVRLDAARDVSTATPDDEPS